MKRYLRKWFQIVNRTYAVRGRVEIGKDVHIGIGTVLDAQVSLKVADDVYIGKYCCIECDGYIGSGTMIANHVGLIGRRDHDYRSIGRTIRHSPWIGDDGFPADLRGMKLIIEEDCWIGFGAIVLTGVRVGRGAIVGAGSVVTKDVEPYVIVTGNPATKAGERFTPEQITQHERALYGRTVTSASG